MYVKFIIPNLKLVRIKNKRKDVLKNDIIRI